MDNFSIILPASLQTRLADDLIDWITVLLHRVPKAEQLTAQIGGLRLDAAFRERFTLALTHALETFTSEYEAINSSLVREVLAQPALLEGNEFRIALQQALERPDRLNGALPDNLRTSIEYLLPTRSKEDLEHALRHLLLCFVYEVWAMPEFALAYALLIPQAAVSDIHAQ